MAPNPENHSRTQDRKDRAEILAKCVSDTVEFINSHAPGTVAASPVAGLLLANSYFLVSDGYKIHRGMQHSRTHPYKVAAFTTATIMAIRPVRVLDTANVISVKAAFANQQCVMRAAQGLLGLDLEKLDDDFIRRLYVSVFDPIELPCLSPYLKEFEDRVGLKNALTFEEIEKVVSFDQHNNLTFSKEELQMLEALINQFTTLEKAAGHPFRRIFASWGRWWT
jgi:hypothetical protein